MYVCMYLLLKQICAFGIIFENSQYLTIVKATKYKIIPGKVVIYRYGLYI